VCGKPFFPRIVGSAGRHNKRDNLETGNPGRMQRGIAENASGVEMMMWIFPSF